jgi:septal ring factor EnvC (AmiA/AmiB activator)
MCLVLTALLAFAPAFAAKKPVARLHPHTEITKPRPKPPPPPQPDSDIDITHAVPMKSLVGKPSTAEQFRDLTTEIAKDKPAAEAARAQSEKLAQEADLLQKRLVDTATRVEALELDKSQIERDVVRLSAEDQRLSASFARDRVQVAHLLAVLERLQHDMPPAMAVRPDDALSAARGAMLIGASVPRVYQQAATLARRLEELRKTRAALVERRAQATETADRLAGARAELDQLLAMKRLEAGAAASRYSDLKRRVDTIASQAVSLQALLQKVAQLRSATLSQPVVSVNASADSRGKLGRGWLLPPVIGTAQAGGLDGVGGSTAPGITYVTAPLARVISPADGRVKFAADFKKTGRLLILEIGGGYLVVLAGLDRLDVRPDDAVLAGEPVGVMSKFDHEPRLYFELRLNGRGMSPAPYISVASRKKT